MRKALVLGVLGLAGTLASPAFADDFSGFRLAMNMNSDQLEGDFAFQGIGVDPINNNRFGYGLSGGWALNRYFAVEVGYHGGSEFNSDVFPGFLPSISVLPPVTDPVTPDSPPFFTVRNNYKSIDASAVGSLWIGNKFSLFGRIGMQAWKGETSYSYGDADAGFKTVDTVDDTDFAPFGGLGIQTVLDRALIRVEYQYVDVGDLPVSTYFGTFDNTITSLSFSVVWTLR
jgi:opacity protein-like surface antigen